MAQLKPPLQSIHLRAVGDRLGLLDVAGFGLMEQPEVNSVTTTRATAALLVTNPSLAGAHCGLLVLELAVKVAPRSPSRTAVMTAVARAMHREVTAPIFDDFLALPLAGEEGPALLERIRAEMPGPMLFGLTAGSASKPGSRGRSPRPAAHDRRICEWL